MDLLIDNPSTFGKLNCTLVFSVGKQHLKTIYEDIVRIFKPNNEDFSTFDLQDFEMNDFDISKPFEDDESIRKVIFTKGINKIIFEYYKGKYTIQHLPSFDDNGICEGLEIIKKYCCEFDNTTIVCGFELSLDIDDYPESLTSLIKDDSLHPLIIFTSVESNRFTMTTHDSISDNVSTSKKDRMGKYVELLDLPVI